MHSSWTERWHHRRILVLGDVMLDRFIYGAAERVSPEAPTLILRYQKETAMLGGAGNVARNIIALGGRVVLAGVLGCDEEGDLIANRLAAEDGIEGHWVRTENNPTTLKVRYVAAGQQLMRFDREKVLAPDASIADALGDIAGAAIDSVDAVVLSDYAKGVLSPQLVRRVIELAQARGIPVVVDPKTREVERYAGATVLTPNTGEASAICGFDAGGDEAAAQAAELISQRARVSSIVLTRGSQGMMVWDSSHAEEGAVAIPGVPVEVFDVSGAGDTVVAGLVLALAAGATIATGARIANVAAGIAVGKRGTAVVKASELARALSSEGQNRKVAARDEAAAIVADWKAHGLSVGFTNGCFDLIHPGHVELLRKARLSCDRLVVALNTDASVKRLKGETRPIQNEVARSVVMSAMESVDLVALFDEDTPAEMIETLRPDVLIKGADYTIATVVGADFVQSYGGRVVLIPLEAGQSTTSIVTRSNAGKP